MEEQDKQAKKSGEKAAARRRCKGERERLDRKREAKVIIKRAQRLKAEKLEHVKATKEPSFKHRGCPDSKQRSCPEPSSSDRLDRDVCSKRKTGWSERAGGVLRGGAPGSGSYDLVSTLTTCVNLHHKTVHVPVQITDKSTAHKDEAEEDDSSKGRTREQLDRYLYSKDRGVSSKRWTGWKKVDGGLEVWRSGVLRGGAPATGSKDSVSTFTTFLAFITQHRPGSSSEQGL